MEAHHGHQNSPGTKHQNSFAYKKNTSFANTQGREKDGLMNPTRHNQTALMDHRVNIPVSNAFENNIKFYHDEQGRDFSQEKGMASQSELTKSVDSWRPGEVVRKPETRQPGFVDYISGQKLKPLKTSRYEKSLNMIYSPRVNALA